MLTVVATPVEGGALHWRCNAMTLVFSTPHDKTLIFNGYFSLGQPFRKDLNAQSWH
jgi:hypothetical protein